MTRGPAAGWVNYHARATPDRIAIVDAETRQRHTYAELDDWIRRVAAALSGQLKVATGDRVAMLSGNCVEAIVLMYACAEVGAIFVPLNIRLSNRELEELIDDCGPRILVGEDDLLRREMAVHVPQMSWGEMEAAGARIVETQPAVDLDPDTPWLIIYTSGTTGVPKGAVVTHSGSNAAMLAAVMSASVDTRTVCLTALPLWHVAGLNLFTNPTLFMGGTVILMRSFDAAEAVSLLTAAEMPVTHFTGVPAHYQFMDGVLGDTVLPMFVAAVGGSPVSAALIERWAARGVELRPVYGITEAGATVAMMPPGTTPGAPGDVGVSMNHIRCRVAVTESGAEGELLIAGTSVTPGYWNKPVETARSIVDGWLHTGDIATIMPNGHIRILDRLKDMYISGGENVYPAEVEDALCRHPAVAAAAVVGVPDERWGETGSAWVVLNERANSVDIDALRAWLRELLGGFKVPRDIAIVESLPRNATGKVLKKALRHRSSPMSDGPKAR
ncbi:hypothetical protein BA059_27365 [Mycolicibacterium sp. (ex Dasyatis americana)]|nr:hypothetical protein BA059_27365 [Mycolicibacterium sp. (ex Dasyatis americana)]